MTSSTIGRKACVSPRVDLNQERSFLKLTKTTGPWITCVVPAYNESAGIAGFLGQLCAFVETLTDRFEVIIVNDGSSDGTAAEVMAASAYLPVQLISLSRNFGKEAAISAGLDEAKGDVVVVIDADFQQPIELIGEYVARIFTEVKQRPNYLVAERHGFPGGTNGRKPVIHRAGRRAD